MATNIEKLVVGSTLLPVSSSLQIDEEDVSSPEAGRTEDGKMHKMKIGTLRSISVSWRNLKSEELKTILEAVRDEYLQVYFYDPSAGKHTSSEFYIGNRTMAIYNGDLDLWQNLSFKFIERSVKK